MTNCKPQIAYAPVQDPSGYLSIVRIRRTEEQAQDAVGKAYADEDGWLSAKADGWRIKRVRIEIDE